MRALLLLLIDCPSHSTLQHPLKAPRTLSTLPSTSYTITATMQTAIQSLAQPLHHAPLVHRPQYAHSSINATVSRAGGGLAAAVPTPPSTRKRKRPVYHSVSYSEVQEVDDSGRLREVIVIEDTPPPPATISPAVSTSTVANGYSISMQPPIFNAPIRTRARAAAEAQAMSASTSSSTAGVTVPAPKKRKREPELDALLASSSNKKPALNGTKYNGLGTVKQSWASGSNATTADDVSFSFPCIRV